MYDRKTWIVLALCGTLLALGMMENSRHAAAREKQRQEQVAKDKAAAEEKVKQAPTPAPAVEAVPKPEVVTPPPAPPAEKKAVTLETDKMVFTLSNIGGGIDYADFKAEKQVAKPDQPVRVNERGGAPIAALSGPDAALKNVPYAYDEAASVPGKKVVYSAVLDNGLKVTKIFSLVAGDAAGTPYLVDCTIALENTAAAPFGLKEWSVYAGDAEALHKGEQPNYIRAFWSVNGNLSGKEPTAFKGGMMSSAKDNIDSPVEKIGQAGVTNQFFTTVLRPVEPQETSVWMRPSHLDGLSVRLGLRFPDVTLNPAETRSFSYQIFIGPKHNPMLRKMGPGWGDVMQYGGPIADWFLISPVARALNWLLNVLHDNVTWFAKKWSWGLAIILLTIVVRSCIWPLHAKSTRTMKRMSKLQPEIAKLKEKYPDDPNKLNTEMMGLYRKYGINPLGGCLPMFVQIPIFFGFYTMLQYAVELRHQPFLWVNDLSQPDTLFHVGGVPINILPVVMAISSFLQIKMTPQTGDPTQQKIIKFMPFVFFFFCYNFASALALYWTTQNIFSIGQTWLMNRVPEPALVPRKDGGKKSWMQRMAEQQAAAQKARQSQSAGGQADSSRKPRPPRTGG